jgi:hypothetical protein
MVDGVSINNAPDSADSPKKPLLEPRDEKVQGDSKPKRKTIAFERSNSAKSFGS